MKIPLNEFEQYIDETILKRGLEYFKKGLVSEPDIVGVHDYQFIVNGTEPYIVDITIKNETITEYVCTCPYDYGPVCKHVAAVIFYLQQENLDIKTSKKRTKRKNTYQRKNL